MFILLVLLNVLQANAGLAGFGGDYKEYLELLKGNDVLDEFGGDVTDGVRKRDEDAGNGVDKDDIVVNFDAEIIVSNEISLDKNEVEAESSRNGSTFNSAKNTSEKSQKKKGNQTIAVDGDIEEINAIPVNLNFDGDKVFTLLQLNGTLFQTLQRRSELVRENSETNQRIETSGSVAQTDMENSGNISDKYDDKLGLSWAKLS